jgi:AraC-like DNA-binding protein
LSTIQKYDFKEGLPQEFEILDMGKLFAERAEDMASPHRLGFYQILWFKNGSSSHLVDFNPVEIKPNTVVFINKNSVQRFDTSESLECTSLLFTDSFFCKTYTDSKYLKNSILFNDLLSIPKIQVPKSLDTLASLFDQMKMEVGTEKDDYQNDLIRNYLKNFLLVCERERRNQDFTPVKQGEDLEYVMQFREFLDEQYMTNKLVSQYAELISITVKRLNKATSKVLGKTPKQLIDARIILEAKRLLAHTSDSVKQIGFELGFDEPTNFIKYFKKHLLATPIEFRAQFSK